MSRAARNSTCCDHASADHDLFGCAVNVSTEAPAYLRCHGLVACELAESLAQMRRGEGVVLIPRPDEEADR